MTLHVVPKTLRPEPPPPHLTAFAWTEERGLLVPAWSELRVHREHRAGVLVPWDRVLELSLTARTRTWWDDDGSFTSQTFDEDGRLVWTCWIAPLAAVYLPEDTAFHPRTGETP